MEYTTNTWYLNSNGAGDGLTFNQTYNAVNNAFNSWENISTSNVDFTYGGDDFDYIWGNDNKNVVFWAELGDEIYDLQPQIAHYALTYITVNVNHEITELDIILPVNI